MKIFRKGQIDIDNQPLVHKWKESETISIDLITKRGDTVIGYSSGVPEVILYANDDSVHAIDTELPTHIRFPEHVGWTLLLAEICKYSLNITFVR